jgi:hypothetical protein
MSSHEFAPVYHSRFLSGIAAGQFWAGGGAEPAELARLEKFAAELERQGQNVASFVASGRDRYYSPGRIIAWSILGPHFVGDLPAAAEFWDELGGDVADLDFVVGFAQGALDSD